MDGQTYGWTGGWIDRHGWTDLLVEILADRQTDGLIRTKRQMDRQTGRCKKDILTNRLTAEKDRLTDGQTDIWTD